MQEWGMREHTGGFSSAWTAAAHGTTFLFVRVLWDWRLLYTFIYIMHKKGTSLRLPVLFTKFRPPKIKRKILLQNPFIQLKTRQFCERENFWGKCFATFQHSFFWFVSFLKQFSQFSKNLWSINDKSFLRWSLILHQKTGTAKHNSFQKYFFWGKIKNLIEYLAIYQLLKWDPQN